MTEVMELAGKELKTSVVNHIGVFDNIKENISMMRRDMKDLILKRTRDLDYNIVASTCLLFDPRE